MNTRSTWILVFAVVCGVIATGLLSYTSGRGEGYQAGLEHAAEISPNCPTYPGAEQHSVEEWVCETEEDWAKLLMDCNEEANAVHVLTEIVGEQEQKLERCRFRCTRRSDEQMKEIRRNTAEAVRNLAAERAIKRKNEEDED